MRKLTHKTHKIVPCKWNNWHNVSIKRYLTMALTPDFSLSLMFTLLIFAKSIFYYCVPTCYLSQCLLTMGHEWCSSPWPGGGQMSADCDMFHPLHFTRHYHGQLWTQSWYSSLSLISSAPHRLMMPLKYLYHHYSIHSLSGFSFDFVYMRHSFWNTYSMRIIKCIYLERVNHLI